MYTQFTIIQNPVSQYHLFSFHIVTQNTYAKEGNLFSVLVHVLNRNENEWKLKQELKKSCDGRLNSTLLNKSGS